MITLSPSNSRRGYALTRMLFAAALMLTGAIMAVFAGSPQSEDAAPSAPATKAGSSNGIYIVTMRAEPAATYRGGVPGLRATAPAPGGKINQKSAEVVRYTDHLRSQHDAMISRVGAEKVYSYVYALNGFAAKMTAKQAAELRNDPDVLSVDKDQAVSVDTSTTHRMLGLSAPGGLWEQLGGGNNQTNGPGENMVVGVVDTGIHPEHPSFKATNDQGTLIYPPIADHTGTCQPTAPDNSWNASFCNGKIVSAKKYNQGHGGDAGVAQNMPWEFLSPRDWDGHGSHTASTAAGNFGITPNNNLVVHGSMSGMAPRARIAVYKACWETMTTSGGCFFSDTSAAVDAATGDGVDAINYSIGGLNTFNNVVENAFRNAAAAGVFVSNSAGNDGPGASTVAKPGPWTINVANATHDRAQVAKLTLGNGQEFVGPSVTTSSAGPAPLIRAQDAAAATAPSADSVRLCFSKTWNGSAANPGPASLDPAKVQGKIVVCERGNNDRVDKSKAVQEAGGVGMVLVNVTAGTLNADAHSVPTVHLDHNARTPIQAYAQTANASATISTSFVTTVPAPFISSSSSRGPINAAGGDILKPDVAGPGSDVLAAVAPPGNGGQTFALYSGTSMAAPHIAGVGLLLKQLHPTWSPMMIKSALMTTGINILDNLTEANRIFAQGAGWIQPNNANNPGLVYDSNQSDWQAFLCAVGVNPGGGQATCDALAAAGYDTTNPSNMNRASIAIGDLVGTERIVRRVTNVSNSTVTFTSSVTGLAGINVAVSPSSLTLAPGQTASFNVDFTRVSGAFNAYIGGQLTWTGGGHTVRIPMVVRPLNSTVALERSSNGADIDMPIKFGYQGTFTAVPRGLIPATTTQGTVQDDPNNTGAWTPTTPGTVFFDFAVPAGTTFVRFSLFDANTDKPGLHDLDLHLYRLGNPNTQIVESENATSNEDVSVHNPVADTYRVYVHGYDADGGSATFTLFAWVLGSNATGNMHVLSPWQATVGQTSNIHVEFSNLAPNTRYLGTIAYSGQAGLPNPTVIRVDTPSTTSAPAELVSVVSTRTHGALGERELVFPAGTRAIESRRGANYNGSAGDYTVTFRFSAPIAQATASKTSGTGTISGKTQSGTDLAVNVTGVKNGEVLTFNLSDVVDEAGNALAPVDAQLSVLVGDVNADGVVNAGDVTRVRSNSGSSADGAAIASDINCDGVVNSGDVTAVKNASGSSL